MREFEFSRDEEVLTRDEAWRRLFARVAPEIRRDMVGWLRLNESNPLHTAADEGRDSIREILKDYFVGASLVLDQLPERPYDFHQDDREALAADLHTVSTDVRYVYECVNFLKFRRELQSERSSERARTASGAAKEAAAG